MSINLTRAAMEKKQCGSLSGLRIAVWILSLCLVCLSPFAGWAEENGGDLFDNQILSLSKPVVPLVPSGDPRFRDNQDGTVSDLTQGLMWKQSDSYQEQKAWINWDKAQEYLQEANAAGFAGYRDWRLPTRDELLSLYDKEKSIPWNYYWQNNEVHIDPVFGHTSCCFWTSEVKGDYAWGVNFIRGKTYLSMRAGPGLSLSVIRLVRKDSHEGDPAGESKAAPK